MKMVKNILKLLVAVSILPVWSCTTSDTDLVGDNRFEIPENRFNYNFRETDEIVFIPVRTTIPESQWEVDSPDADWCKVAKSYDNAKGLYLSVDANEEVDVRKTSFKVRGGCSEYEFTVRQLGYGPAILVNSQVVGQGGGDVSIVVTSNIDVLMGNPKLDAEDDPDWLEVRNDGLPLTRAFADGTYQLWADINAYPYERKATVEFTAADPMYMTDDVKAVCVITQSTGSVKAEVTYPDKKAQILKGTVDQAHNGSPITKMYDGETDKDGDANIYHSPWAGEGGTKFPITMQFEIYPASVSYFKYYTRFSDSSNGNPGAFDVFYRKSGETAFVPVKEGEFGSADNSMYDFGMTSGVKRCTFPSTITDVQEIKLVFYSGKGDLLSGVEIEFYEDMSKSVNDEILKVFTDLSCSELREGVTRQDITALYGLVPYLAQEVAMRFYSNTYVESEKEFRIHEYEPYSSSEQMFTKMRTRRYTQHDNPTGIFVQGGQTLLICIDDIPAGQTVSLGVANENGDGYAAQFAGFNFRTELMKGFNEVTVPSDGMCFIINTASELTSASKSVKVHILPGCGRVDGYFDIARHSDADYVRMLNATGWKYFIAKGQNMIFMMHTSTLRGYAPTGIISGLSAWDDILGWQFELMGIGYQTADGKWDRMIDRTHFNNHMVAISNTNPTSYMDASDYRINFNASSGIPKIISRELLLAAEDNTWGPAHEAGHVNQRAIMWKSNAESSNNLFSNYAIYKFGKYGSRGATIKEIADCCARGESWVEMGDATHMNESTEIHMRMQWQLWNYFHRCGVDSEFWPRLFELCRTKYILPNGEPSGAADHGLCQMMFAKAVCEAAQMDFTRFFEAWGFLKPVDITYEQYGSARYRVTDAMIADLRANMASYPTKAPAVEFIEDRDVKNGVRYSELGYYTTFRDKTSVTGTPTYTVEGTTVRVSNCSGAVGIELRATPSSGEELGDLRYFANMSNFDVPTTVSLTSSKVYAVQWDGKRIEATRK